MLKHRLIPKLQLKSRRIGKFQRLVVVTTKCFENPIEIGDAVSQAKIYQSQMSDELMLLDLDAHHELRSEFVDLLGKISTQVFMPIAVGGGVKNIDDFKILLHNGADKVCINTHAVENPDLINHAAENFGSQCVVVSIDYRNSEGSNSVWSKGGKVKSKWTPLDWAIEAERRGAGELLLTSIDRDGTSRGLDILTARSIVEAVSIPVIVSGGCGLAAHFIEGFLNTKAQAIASGTFFSSKDQNPMQTRAHIKNADIPIRLHI